jgi:ankyrin repeat protein
LAELLLAKGADINGKTEDGNTPLDMAKRNLKKDLIELLHSHPAGAKERRLH